MSNESTIHPQVNICIAMLCEGFNVPLSETKIKAFAEQIGSNPHLTSLRQAYDTFASGRGSTQKMPTVAEFKQVYDEIKKRNESKQNEGSITYNNDHINYEHNKIMFQKLVNLAKKGGKKISGICDRTNQGYQDGYKFTLKRDENGKDHVYYHNHPINNK